MQWYCWYAIIGVAVMWLMLHIELKGYHVDIGDVGDAVPGLFMMWVLWPLPLLVWLVYRCYKSRSA